MNKNTKEYVSISRAERDNLRAVKNRVKETLLSYKKCQTAENYPAWIDTYVGLLEELLNGWGSAVGKELNKKNSSKKGGFKMKRQLKHSYWNGDGKHQAFVDKLSGRIPDYGRTENENINAFILMSNLYWDVYNNGGCNIESCYLKEVNKNILLADLDIQKLLDENFGYLEGKMNELLEYLESLDEKELAFPIFTLWLKGSDGLLSKKELPGFSTLTFSTEEALEDCVKHQLKWGFNWVAE